MSFTLSEKENILNLYKDMRVTDVRDGMDWIGYHHYGSMSPEMRPLHRTRAIGFANTSRYIPYDRPVPQGMIGEEYTEWKNWYYANICIQPWGLEGYVQKYDMFVVDQSGLNVGVCGSMWTLFGLKNGGVGYVIDGGVRDTDEIILQKTPVWCTQIAQTMDQARIQYENHECKINCCGVCVNPGDLVVADGDGVIVVPQDIVYDVAKYATQEMRSDKQTRRYFYVKLNMELDDTVADSMDEAAVEKVVNSFK